MLGEDCPSSAPLRMNVSLGKRGETAIGKSAQCGKGKIRADIADRRALIRTRELDFDRMRLFDGGQPSIGKHFAIFERNDCRELCAMFIALNFQLPADEGDPFV